MRATSIDLCVRLSAVVVCQMQRRLMAEYGVSLVASHEMSSQLPNREVIPTLDPEVSSRRMYSQT